MRLTALAFLLQASLMAGAWSYPGSLEAVTPFDEGFGTREEPYVIKTAQQLADMAWMVNNIASYPDVYFVLGRDITLNEPGGTQEWVPVGDADNPFKGHFDGQGHVVTGLYMRNYTPVHSGSNVIAEYAGLFGNTDGSDISNLTLENVDIRLDVPADGESSSVDFYVGSVVGYNRGGSVTDCTASGTVSCSIALDSSEPNIGGIAGEILDGGELSGCAYSGLVSLDAPSGVASIYSGVGGIAGSATVARCHDCANSADVTVSSGEVHASGIAVLLNTEYDSPTMSDLVNRGNITATRGGAAGIAFWLSGSAITGCHNYGTVSNGTGGVYGCYGITSDAHFSSMTNCSNNGSVDGAGLVGYGDFLTLVEDCTNIGDVGGCGILGGCGPYPMTMRRCINRGRAHKAGILGDIAEGLVMEDCANYGDITGRAGIVCGIYQSPVSITLTRCENSGNIDGSADYQSYYIGMGTKTYYTSLVGGIINTAGTLTISGCRNSGTVTGPFIVGGVVGHASDVDMDDCHNTATVNCLNNPALPVEFDGEAAVGGVIGNASSLAESDRCIRGCSNAGDVTIDRVSTSANLYSARQSVGGIVGLRYGNVLRSSNTGNISVGGNGIAGALAGSAQSATFTECYSVGSITGSADYAGGFAGYSDNAVFKDCYTAGRLSASTGIVAGFTGYTYSTSVSSSFSYLELEGSACYRGAYCAGRGNYLGNVYALKVPGVSFDENEEGYIDGKVTVATAERFASGEICNALINGRDNSPWGQDIGIDPYPLLNGLGAGITDAQTTATVADWRVYDYTGRYAASGHGSLDDVTRLLAPGLYIAVAAGGDAVKLLINR